MNKNIACPDCGVKEGELHLENCDIELCTKCGKQVLGWGRCKGAKRGRYFANAGYMCQRCGRIMFPMKMVSDKLWTDICAGSYDKTDMLCPSCMDFIIEKRGLDKEEGRILFKELNYGHSN